MSVSKCSRCDDFSVNLICFKCFRKGDAKTQKIMFDAILKNADEGCCFSQYQIGTFYLNGLSVEQNIEKAFSWFSKSAEKDYKPSLFAIGTYYYGGVVVNADYMKAYECFIESEELQQSLCSLAVMYYEGKGVEKNNNKSFEYFVRASKIRAISSHMAYYNLGVYYWKGYGTNIDEKKSIEYFLKSIKISSHFETKISANIRNILDNSKNREELVRIFNLDYNIDNPSNYHIAICLQKGILGYKKDKSMAFHYFKVLSHQNNENSKIILKVLENLKEIPEDLKNIIIDYFLE